MTAVSYPPPVAQHAAQHAAHHAAHVVMVCSHCGAEIELDTIADALKGAFHAATVPDGLAPLRPYGERVAALRPRQREIVELLGDGWRVPAIAERLGITVATVRKHLRALYAVLGVRSQAELVGWLRADEVTREPRLRAVVSDATLGWEANAR